MASLVILILAAVTLSLPGSFLVLRKLSMLGDALSHTVLLGIVLGFFIVPSLDSPVLILMATLFSLLMVTLVEWLTQKGIVKSDAAIGIVFPLFFALGVILLSKYLRNVHLDLDCVIMGDLTFADLVTYDIGGLKIPKAILHLAVVLILNVTVIALFFKELQLSSFDPITARIQGFKDKLLSFILSALVAVSAVVSFQIVGAILVIAFLVIPASAALLYAKSLKQALLYAVLFAVVTSSAAYGLAVVFNVNAAGFTAAIMGLVYGILFTAHKVTEQKRRRGLAKS